jgi:GTPase SAR1 family protein
VILAGNKCDMAHERVVPSAEGERLASELGTYLREKHALLFVSFVLMIKIILFFIGLEFFETSAKENVNVKIVFER